MIIVVKNKQDKEQVNNLISWVKGLGLDVHESIGEQSTILGLVGDTSKVDIDLIESLDIVDSVKRIQEPFKNANKKFHPEDTIVDVKGLKIGGGHFQIFAGPCSVESEKQIIGIAKQIKKAGATILRGGAFKPRTSPYAFQGLRETGLEYLKAAREETGMPICTELMKISDIKYFEDIDIIQIGARNMQNFDLLKAVGELKKPILLKRGLASTIQEWLMSAEYIMSKGNNQVILCERGIRTFETQTRNTLDLSAVPVVKHLSHLPIIVDPSHATGHSWLVPQMAPAAVAVGADGLMIEVHNDPAHALSDGAQSLKPEQFEEVTEKLKKIFPIFNKKLG